MHSAPRTLAQALPIFYRILISLINISLGFFGCLLIFSHELLYSIELSAIDNIIFDEFRKIKSRIVPYFDTNTKNFPLININQRFSYFYLLEIRFYLTLINVNLKFLFALINYFKYYHIFVKISNLVKISK